MSEFVLLRGENDFLDELGLVRVEVGSDRAPSFEIAKKLPLEHPLEEYWSIADVGGGVFDDLVTDAQRAIGQGRPLEATRLGEFLRRCTQEGLEVYAWYADDSDDFDEVDGLPALLDTVEAALRESTAEFYIHFKGK